ncbi:MAG: hypothetical protein ABI433_10010 [Burkholderiaceae bacterium]
MKTWLKWRLAGRELVELERRQVLAQQYMRWLAEFPDVAMALENLEAEAMGRGVSLSWPPSAEGPWDISRLREVMRARRQPAAKPPREDIPHLSLSLEDFQYAMYGWLELIGRGAAIGPPEVRSLTREKSAGVHADFFWSLCEQRVSK